MQSIGLVSFSVVVVVLAIMWPPPAGHLAQQQTMTAVKRITYSANELRDIAHTVGT